MRTDARTLPGTGFERTGTATYGYDALGRLVTETGLNAERTYSYDLDGNRRSKLDGGVTTSYLYDRTDQLVKQTTTADTAFTYNAFGEMTSKAVSAGGATAMTYDAAGRLISLTTAGGATVTLAYDALGRTATRTTGGVTETYAYAGTGETITGITAGATTRTSLVDASGARLSFKNGASVAWTLFDQLGSTAALVAPDATLLEAYRFDGYGQPVGSQAPIAGGNPFRFRGTLNLASDTDPLYEMGARLYAPSAGTFTQMDSVAGSAADPASMNRFLYAQGNPTSLVDPTGHGVQQGPCGPDGIYCSPTGYNPMPPAVHASPATGTTATTGSGGGGGCSAGHCATTPTAPTSPTAPLVITPDLLDSLTPDQLEKYVDARASGCVGAPYNMPGCQDYGYAFCRLAQIEVGTCLELVDAKDWTDLDGPAGTLVVAPLAALAVALGLAATLPAAGPVKDQILGGTQAAAQQAQQSANIIPRLEQGTKGWGLDHIVFNHWWSSGIAEKSRFAADIGLSKLKALIDSAAGPITRIEDNYYIREVAAGRVIGVDKLGNAASWLRVVMDQGGRVITAYPIAAP